MKKRGTFKQRMRKPLVVFLTAVMVFSTVPEASLAQMVSQLSGEDEYVVEDQGEVDGDTGDTVVVGDTGGDTGTTSGGDTGTSTGGSGTTTPSTEQTTVEQPTAEEARVHTVAFDANGGTGEIDTLEWVEDPATATSGQLGYAFTLPAATPLAREGYRFAGWSTTKDNKDVHKVDDQGNETSEVETPAIFVPDQAYVENLEFDYDANEDGQIAADGSETFDLAAAEKDDGLTLYAQWEKLPEEDEEEQENAEPQDEAEGSADTNADTEDEEPLGDLTGLQMVDAPELTASQFLKLHATAVIPPAGFSTLSVGDDLAGDSNVLGTEGDGSKIENISVEWITGDTVEDNDPSRLSLVLSNDYSFSVVMRVNFQLSGEYDYDPGAIQISVPKYIFKDRNNNDTGTMQLAVPADPSKNATFAYRDMGDYYVLTNTTTLAAATQGWFDFSIEDLIPHTIVDVGSDTDPEKYPGYSTDPFEATISVDTHSGNVITMDSNKIDATIDTQSKVTGANKRAYSVSEAWPGWDASLKPENDEDYIYIDWYTSAYTTGNQAYTMSVTDDADDESIEGEVLLGYRIGSNVVAAEDDALTFTYDYPDTYSSWGTGFYVHVYTAYPKSAFEKGETSTLHNTVHYYLTDVDDGIPSDVEAEGSATYAPVELTPPPGHFYLWKYGLDGTSTPTFGSIGTPYTNGTSTRWLEGDVQGIYGYALNELRAGDDVDVRYQVEGVGFGLPWTYEDDGDGETELSDFGKKSYTITVDDGDETLAGSGLTATEDYYFAGLDVRKPTTYTYERFSSSGYGYYESGSFVAYGLVPAGSYGYQVDGSAENTPQVDVYVQIGSSDEWTHVATYDFTSGSASINTENGATWSGGTYLTFPANVSHWRTVITTTAAGVDSRLVPTVHINATKDVVAAVEQLLQDSDSPTTKSTDTASMTATTEGSEEPIFSMSATGRDKLDGAILGVGMEKTATQLSQDNVNRVVRIRYTATVHEQSNLTDLDSYNAAISYGAIAAETSGTWYDLLPLGVTPDLTTITLRSGDSLESARVVPNYKGTGRTLLIVKASLTPRPSYPSYVRYGLVGYEDAPYISFEATYAYEALDDYGDTLNNVIAFESGNDQLGTLKGYSGEPDNPTKGNNYGSASAVLGVEEAMTNLDSERDDNNFVYANAQITLSARRYAVSGLVKDVTANGTGVYSKGTDDVSPVNVYEGGSYTYRMRYMNVSDNASTNIVLYDSIENYTPGGDSSETGVENKDDLQWRGTFVSVDTSQLEAKGIAPVVYYSTVENLNLSVNYGSRTKGNYDLTDGSIWSTTRPTDLADVTAIAIDCSKMQDQSSFVLGKDDSIAAFIQMKAPWAKDVYEAGGSAEDVYDQTLGDGDTEAGATGGYHAYNDVTVLSDLVTEGTTVTPQDPIHYTYTKVGIIPFEITVKKDWDDGDNRDGKRTDSVTVSLYAGGKLVTDNSDNPCTYALNAENDWSHVFKNVSPVDDDGNLRVFTVRESGNPSGYTIKLSTTQTDEGMTLNVTNVHTPEKTSVSGQKVWDDSANAANKRPSSVVVDLYANGSYVSSKTVTPDSTGLWTYSFDNLYKYEDGKEIVYTVEENVYYEGYVASVDGYDVVNTYSPYGDLRVSKSVAGGTAMTTGQKFDFTFTFYEAGQEGDVSGWATIADEFDYVITENGSTYATGKVKTGDTLSITASQEILVKNLPSESTYLVTEGDVTAFEATEVSGDTGTIRAGQAAEASFVNTYTTSGSVLLEASKTLEGRAPRTHEFKFELVDDNEGSGTYGQVLRSATNASASCCVPTGC